MSRKSSLKEEIKMEIKKPKMYKVVIHNDDYTSMEFVIEVIVIVFHKEVAEATRIMFDVHNKGKGIVGTYPYDIAVTKVVQVEELAKAKGFPLKSSVEEE